MENRCHHDAFFNEGKGLEVKMTLTTPMCPYGPMLLSQVQELANSMPNVQDAKVTLVWEPPWDPKTMASDYAKDKLNKGLKPPGGHNGTVRTSRNPRQYGVGP